MRAGGWKILKLKICGGTLIRDRRVAIYAMQSADASVLAADAVILTISVVSWITLNLPLSLNFKIFLTTPQSKN